jgi:dodecin
VPWVDESKGDWVCGERNNPAKENHMADSVYKVIELIGTSTESWEKAAAAAVQQASKTVRDLRVAEISDLDIAIEDGKIKSYRAKVKVSFKYENKRRK